MIALIPFPVISPEIFSISLFGTEFALRWYALAYIAGILIGWRIVNITIKTPHLWPRDTAPMTPRQVEDLLTWVILGVILGGRLGYVFFYNAEHYIANLHEIPMIWQGGMSFHGGLIGVSLAAYLYARANKLPLLSTADAMAIGTPAGLLLGRIANFINAELWGRETDVPWAVVFPGEMAQTCMAMPGMCGRHPSQLYEALLEGLVLGAFLLWLVYRRKMLKTPGQIAGTFFAGYGVMRFLVENYRQPDAQFISENNPLGLYLHYNGYGLTMGQFLCIPMLFGGIFLARMAARRGEP